MYMCPPKSNHCSVAVLHVRSVTLEMEEGKHVASAGLEHVTSVARTRHDNSELKALVIIIWFPLVISVFFCDFCNFRVIGQTLSTRGL